MDEETVAICQVREDVLLQAKDLILLTIVIVGHEGILKILGRWVGDHAWTFGPTLDGGSDGGEDSLGGEEVDTAVDEIGDLAFRLLDVVKDSLGVGVRDNASEVCSGVRTDSGAKNDSLSVLLFEELEHLLKGKGAADIGVEDEEPLGSALEDGVSEVVEASSSAKSLVLSQIGDFELRKLPRRVSDEISKDTFVVVADQDDFFDTLDFCYCFKAVPDDWVASNIEKRLKGQSDWVSQYHGMHLP